MIFNIYFMSDGFNRGAHCKYLILVHLMFPVYRRKKLLVGDVAGVMKGILSMVAEQKDIEVRAIESDQNHLHMTVSYHQTQSVTEIVHWLKQQSGKRIWDLQADALRGEGVPYRRFWSDGYFAESIGRMDEGAINNYINNQGRGTP